MPNINIYPTTPSISVYPTTPPTLAVNPQAFQVQVYQPGTGVKPGDMFKADFANGSGSANTNKVDHAAWADAAPGTGGGGGDMYKAQYDIGTGQANTNKVDHSRYSDASIAQDWSVITNKPASFPGDWNTTANKPATFPPDATAMLKSVYDTNADNIVDHAALADSAANGIPAGGAAGQVLAKNSATNYDTTWITLTSTSEGIWSYTAGNNTMADPGSGKFRTNTSAFSTATAIAISKTSGQNTDKTNLLSELKSGDTITLQDQANSANYARYTLSAASINNGTWFQLPITYVTGGGVAPNNNVNVIFTFELAQGAAGGGDMTKAVYDTNGNNVVDTCDSLVWTKLTSVPTSFPPDATAELIARKGVASGYAGLDTTGKVPTAQLPATATPSAHASTHNLGGSDPVAPDWTQVANKPAVPGPSTTTPTMDGTGAVGTGTTYARADHVHPSDTSRLPATAISIDAGNQAKLGSDSLIYVPGGINGFITKTAAYTLTLADRNKYIICSSGPWTLTLPAAAAGLSYNIRNDQACTPTPITPGPITIQPASGTIDGLASRTLLSQQDCQIVCDGTNWRSFGLKRDVVIAAVDATSGATAPGILLPAGYRYFKIVFSNVVPVTANAYLQMLLSADGGNTWLTTANYLRNYITTPAGTGQPAVWGYASTDAVAYLSAALASGGTTDGIIEVTLFPGSASRNPSWNVFSTAYSANTSKIEFVNEGAAYNVAGQINAFNAGFNSGNIAQLSVTVIGFAYP